MKKLFTILFSCFIGLFLSAQGYEIATVPNPQIENSNNFVSNPDNILSENSIEEFNQKINLLRQKNGTEIAIVALKSAVSEDVDLFATELYETWKIGDEKQDKGLLILFVLDTKNIVLRTGYGLEGALPDITINHIIREQIVPNFKVKNYDKGISEALDKIVAIINEEGFVESEPESIPWNEIIPYAIASYLFLVLATFLFTQKNINKTEKSNRLTTNLARYQEIKQLNNSITLTVAFVIPLIGVFLILFFFTQLSIVLLLFPIPLTSVPAYLYGRTRMNKARREPIPCNSCNNKMHILSNNREEKKYLNVSQQFEEELNSVDYDVFVCKNCNNQAIFSLDKMSSYAHCPRCKTKAFKIASARTLVHPTHFSSGTKQTTYKCRYCGYEKNDNTRIPRLRSNSSSSTIGGSVFSGSGGFGGGFGGGSTGGGGASGSW